MFLLISGLAGAIVSTKKKGLFSDEKRRAVLSIETTPTVIDLLELRGGANEQTAVNTLGMKKCPIRSIRM